MTNVEALKNLYVANGGSAEDVANLNTSAAVINALAGFIGVEETSVMPAKSSNEYWGTKVSAMQSNVVVADGAISGTLKFIQGGIAPGTLSGDGNFLALQFVDNAGADKIEVGLVPSATGMPLQPLDSDMDAVFKVAGEIEGVPQVLKVVTTVGNISKTQTFDLSGLELKSE